MYLELRFENAKLFRPTSKGGFKANPSKSHFLAGALDDRLSMGYKEPITVNQISNIIHVLFGERPVPSFRFSVSKHDNGYFEKAKNSYLKYDTLNSVIDKKGVVKPIKQFVSTAKAMGNSNVKSTYYTWTDITYYLGVYLDSSENMVNFDEMLKKYGLDRVNYTFNGVLDEIYKSGNIKNLFDCLININRGGVKIKALFNDVLGYYQKKGLLPKTSGMETIMGYTFDSIRLCGGAEIRSVENNIIGARYSNGIASYENLCGDILIPITDEDIKKIENNVGIATLLDGGLVTIKGIIPGLDPLTKKNYISVGGISLEEIVFE